MDRVWIVLLVGASVAHGETMTTLADEKHCSKSDGHGAIIYWNISVPTPQTLRIGGAAYSGWCKTNVFTQYVQWRIRKPSSMVSGAKHDIIKTCVNLTAGFKCPLETVGLKMFGELTCKVVGRAQTNANLVNCHSETITTIQRHSSLSTSSIVNNSRTSVVADKIFSQRCSIELPLPGWKLQWQLGNEILPSSRNRTESSETSTLSHKFKPEDNSKNLYCIYFNENDKPTEYYSTKLQCSAQVPEDSCYYISTMLTVQDKRQIGLGGKAGVNENSTLKFPRDERENGKVTAGQSGSKVRITTLTSSTSTVSSTTVSTSTSTVSSTTMPTSASKVSSTTVPTSTSTGSSTTVPTSTRIVSSTKVSTSTSTVSSTIPTSASAVSSTIVPTSTCTVSSKTLPTIASTDNSDTVLTSTSTVNSTIVLSSASTLGTLSKNLTKQHLDSLENGSSLQMGPSSTAPPPVALYAGAVIGAFVACATIATAVTCWLKRRPAENAHSEPPVHQREEAVYSIVLSKTERLRNGAAATQDSQEYNMPPNNIYENSDEVANLGKGITSNGVPGFMESCASYDNIYGDTGPSEYAEYAVPMPELYGNILTGVADENLYGNIIK